MESFPARKIGMPHPGICCLTYRWQKDFVNALFYNANDQNLHGECLSRVTSRDSSPVKWWSDACRISTFCTVTTDLDYIVLK